MADGVLGAGRGALSPTGSKRPITLAVVTGLATALLLAWLPRTDSVMTILVLLGLISGHPAGPIMSLAGPCARARDPGDRDGCVLHSLLWLR